MKIAVMQPYLFPYIGYWQLINAVDKFVLLDDVNYITRGFINRNTILLNGKPYRFTIPINKASQNRLIKDTQFRFDRKEKEKFLRQISGAYRKSPYYQNIMPLIENIVFFDEDDVTSYIQNSIEVIKKYLEIDNEIYRSSWINKNETLRAQDRIIEICKKEQADIYINPSGGRKLYDHESYEREGIKLFFLDSKTENIIYKQGECEFQPNLSIIDILMFNDVYTIRKFLNQYELNQ